MLSPKQQQQRTLQQRILKFIQACIASTGEAPTMAEIGRRFELKSSASVHEILVKLEKKGYIRRSRGAWRGIRVL
jgi:SOS-response transcriptional repressor LexA